MSAEQFGICLHEINKIFLSVNNFEAVDYASSQMFATEYSRVIALHAASGNTLLACG
jgi:hypothetical protein